MNVSQIIRKARVDADAIRLDTTVSPLWNDLELVDLANEVVDTVIGPQLRLTRRHRYARRMLSTDSSVTIFGQTYNPISLRVVAGTQFLILPPDFTEMIRLTPLVTSGSNTVNAAIRFKPRDIADPSFIESDMADQVNPGSISTNDFFYDIVGEFGATDVPGGGFGNSVIKLTPIGAQTIDTELWYVARQPSVYLSQAGTVSMDSTGLVVTGTGTGFTTVPLPAEFMLGTATAVLDADTNLQYPPVSSVASATSLTLATAVTVNVANYKYQLASVPPVPSIHHRWIATMITDLMVRKISPQMAQARLAATKALWLETVLPDLSAPRQSQEPVYTVPFIPDIL
jgi:hypothetical protein